MRDWWKREQQEGGDLMLAVMFLAFGACAIVGGVLEAQTPAPPQLTHEEQLAQKVFQLDVALETVVKEANDCRGALGPYRAAVRSQELSIEEEQLKAQIEQAHPGYRYDTRTGTFTPKPDGPQPEGQK